MCKNFSSFFLSRYPNGQNVLVLVANAINQNGQQGDGITPENVPFAVWTPANLLAVKKYFGTCSGLCQNSAAQYLARLRAALQEATTAGLLPPLDLKGFCLRQLRSKGIYVDSEKLKELEAYQAKNPLRADKQRSVRIAQLLALISARTGARASDVIRLTTSNIRDGLLTYVPKKTAETSGKVCVVPVGPKTRAMIAEVTELAKDIDISTDAAERAFYERYKRSLYHIVSELPWDEEVVIFAQNKQQIKPFKDCVTTHTMRHSFATNMYLDEEVGGDIYAIAQMMGHSSVDMTMSYICVPFNEKKMRRVKYFE